MSLPIGLSALAGALLHSLWQATLVCAIAWFVTGVVLRRRAASTRFAVMHAAVWAALVSLAWTWASLWSEARSIPVIARGTPNLATPPGESVLPWWVLGAWMLGASWHAVRLVVGVAGVTRWRRRAIPVDHTWRLALDALRETMAVSRTVLIGACRRIDAPIVFGALRPMILVPVAWAAGVPTAAMRAALAHELAHVARHDYAIQLAMHVIGTIFHFHPGVRWMLAELTVLRELSCDELATARAIDPLDYAQGLAELEATRVLDAPVLAANGAPLVQRIQHLVSHTQTLPHASVRTPLVTAILAALIATLPPVVALSCQVEQGAAPPVTRSAAVDRPQASEVGESEADDTVIAVPWLRDGLDQHAEAIALAADRHGVDPSLLAIVTWVESRGHADARSPAGARGLMQLMPETAASIALERGIADHRAERLDDPAYNLDMGAYHLAQLIDSYGGGDELDADVIGLAAAAYNGGARRVEAWRGGEALPEETARYREIVVAMWQAREDEAPPKLE